MLSYHFLIIVFNLITSLQSVLLSVAFIKKITYLFLNVDYCFFIIVWPQKIINSCKPQFFFKKKELLWPSISPFTSLEEPLLTCPWSFYITISIFELEQSYYFRLYWAKRTTLSCNVVYLFVLTFVLAILLYFILALFLVSFISISSSMAMGRVDINRSLQIFCLCCLSPSPLV